MQLLLILTTSRTIVQCLNPGNQHWYNIITKYRLYSNFASFPTNVIFLIQDPNQNPILHLAILSPWRRQWHPTPVFLPGKSHGWRSLVSCSPWDRWVRHNWATSLSFFTFMHWRRKWQPTPVFLPGESQKRGSLVGCHLWGHAESDMTEVT